MNNNKFVTFTKAMSDGQIAIPSSGIYSIEDRVGKNNKRATRISYSSGGANHFVDVNEDINAVKGMLGQKSVNEPPQWM